MKCTNLKNEGMFESKCSTRPRADKYLNAVLMIWNATQVKRSKTLCRSNHERIEHNDGQQGVDVFVPIYIWLEWQIPAGA